MREHELPEDQESFTILRATQEALERHGYFLQPVPREHTEAGVTDPLVHRLHTLTKKRGFTHVAGHVMITFSGYARDEREIIAIPEIRSYWRSLDAQVPELPGLVAYLPHWRFNGPGFHVMLLGTIEEMIPHPELEGYITHVVDAAPLVTDALKRIQQAGRKYHLPPNRTQQLLADFLAGVTHQLGQT
jgi:hypothetical protein